MCLTGLYKFDFNQAIDDFDRGDREGLKHWFSIIHYYYYYYYVS